MKKKEFLAEIRDLTVKDVRAKIVSLSEELMKLRFRSAVNQLDQTHQFKELKTNIAQAKTVLNSKLAEAKVESEKKAA